MKGLSLLDGWAEAVLHVLAHVRATAHLPASVYDADHVAFAARLLGPASSRTLAEDADLLGRLLPTHDALARAQALAWLFRSPERALATADRDLADLGAADVDRPALLPLLAGDPATEILRAAAALELPLLARLPPVDADLGALAKALDEVAAAAPRLRASHVAVSRALGWRGRVMGDEIWVGCREVSHAAWQAAHEATVAEVEDEGARGYESVERAAIARLAERARGAGLARAHGEWLGFYGEEPVGAG